jgi:hypothetical protein
MGEVGVMDDVVLDPSMLTITSDSEPPGRGRPDGEPESSKMPLGYQSEVSGGFCRNRAILLFFALTARW